MQKDLDLIQNWYKHRVFHPFLFNSCRDKEDFEDLVQDVFVFLLEHLPEIRQKSKVSFTEMQRMAYGFIKNFILTRNAKKIREKQNIEFLPFDIDNFLYEQDFGLQDFLFEYKQIKKFEFKGGSKMKKEFKEQMFDFIVQYWTEKEKDAIKNWLKKSEFTPDDIYDCFGFFKYDDKECSQCVLNRLCALSLKLVWFPYLMDFIKNYLTEDDRRELFLSFKEVFGDLVNFRPLGKASTVPEDELGLEKYGFNLKSKVGRGAFYLIKTGSFKEAVEGLKKDFGIGTNEAERYIKSQVLYFLRKRGFTVTRKDDDKFEIELPKG